MKTSQENILSVLKDKSILFIENDMGLYNGLDKVEELLIENKIKYNCLFDVSSLPLEYVKKQIEWSNVIIFQTTWTYEVSKQIHDFIASIKNDNKIIIEHYVNEPSWYYKPDVAHDVYICRTPLRDLDDIDDWEFYLLSEEPYWDYENKFDK